MIRRAAASTLLVVILSSCSAAPHAAGGVPPLASVSATAPAPSSTVAFPTLVPTATWTAGPTLTPTTDPRPGIGPVVVHDEMDDASGWLLSTSSTGGTAIVDGRLTLSVREARAVQAASRTEPVLGDFYAEIDALTEVCNPGDELGMTARGNAAEQYRFLIGCDGTARITRILVDDSRSLTLRLPSQAIVPGAPARHRLAIWLHGLDLRFFVNGEEVAAVRDAALTRGRLGLMARAGPGGQISAAFDDLVVYALADPSPTPRGGPTLAGATAIATP
jgi:hypothetical protein